MENGICAIAVMAKAPQPGRSKTRLCPPLQPEGAAFISAAFLRDITENLKLAAKSVAIEGWVAFAPAGTEALFDGHLATGTKLLLVDGQPDVPPDVTGLGRSLLHAFRALLATGASAVCAVNADSPTLPTEYLVSAARTLLAPGERVVLGPTDDGGYYLIGMQRAHARLFGDIAWSTDRVADATRDRAAELGLELVELPSWYDVDDRAALARLLDETGRLVTPDGLQPYLAPATTAALRSLDLRQALAAE